MLVVRRNIEVRARTDAQLDKCVQGNVAPTKCLENSPLRNVTHFLTVLSKHTVQFYTCHIRLRYKLHMLAIL